MQQRRGESFDGIWPTIDPTAWVHSRATVIGDVTLGAEVSIWPNATLRGDEGRIIIGPGSNIQDGSTVHLTGGMSETMVGARVTVGHNVILHGCIVEDDCLIGMGAVLLDNARIGAGSFIGAGTLIPPGKIIPPGSFVVGNPFRIIRPCGPREAEWIAHGCQHYIEQARKYRERDAQADAE